MRLGLALKYLVTQQSVLQPSNDAVSSNLEITVAESLVGTGYVLPINYENVVTLAKVSYNAYINEKGSGWYDTVLNKTVDVTDSKDSIHAFVFSSEDGNVNVLAIKGTSIYWSTMESQSSVYNDKLNDNLFFSCCFYKQSSMFKKACNCTTPANTCCKDCYTRSTDIKENYYALTDMLVQKVMRVVKDITVITGHSLGGALSTMVGVKYKKQVVTFESPGEKHYIDLLRINYSDESLENIYHFGHNADILFTGKCNGVMSWCYLGGYVIETKCHVGKVCMYDTIGQLKMKESIFTHKIEYVINNVITKWNNTLPECVRNICTECESWIYT